MKIGIDGNEANVLQRVGSGQYGFEILKYLARVKTAHQFLIYLKTQPVKELPKETKNWHYKVFGPKKLWTQVGLPLNLYFKKPRPDVFFTPTHYAPRFSPVPVVITIFDLSFLHFPEMFRQRDLLQLTNWTQYSIRKAVKIITISKFSKKEIVNNYHLPEEKVVVTYPGVDTNFYQRPTEAIISIKKKYKIFGDYIIFVGTLQPRKNLERLIAAFNLLIKNLKLKTYNLKLVIAGQKGWLYETIFAKVKTLGLENRVIFTDYVSNSKLPALISGAMVYVLPSLYEGFGMPVIEAQACGVPVVVANTSSLPEIIGESGVLVDPGNAEDIAKGLERVLADQAFARKLTELGFTNSKRFSWANCVKETLKVLKTAANND